MPLPKVASTAPSYTPTGDISPLAPPDHMSEIAQSFWAGIVPMLLNTGVIREVDVLALEMLCECYSDYVTADQELRNNWIIQTRSDGSRVPILSRYLYKYDQQGNRIISLHPAYGAKREAMASIKSWLAELGMSPAARARIIGSVHGLNPDEKRAGAGGASVEELNLGDLSAEDRDAMRQILQRRLATEAEVA